MTTTPPRAATGFLSTTLSVEKGAIIEHVVTVSKLASSAPGNDRRLKFYLLPNTTVQDRIAPKNLCVVSDKPDQPIVISQDAETAPGEACRYATRAADS